MAGIAAMVRRLDVLLVHDDHVICEPLAAALRQKHEVRVAHGLRGAVEELVRHVPDAIVCDQDLSPYCGDVFLAMVAREHPEVRRVLYAGPHDHVGDFGDVAHVTLPRWAALDELLRAIAGDE